MIEPPIHVLLLAALIIGGCRTDLVFAVERPMSRPTGPWVYETDQLRVRGLVVEPLCPAETSTAYGAHHSIATCVVSQETVSLTLRPGLRKGGSIPVGWPEVLDALGQHVEDGDLVLRIAGCGDANGTFKPEEVGEIEELALVCPANIDPPASVTATARHRGGRSVSGAMVRDLLSDLLVIFPTSGGGCGPVGTGPFHVVAYRTPTAACGSSPDPIEGSQDMIRLSPNGILGSTLTFVQLGHQEALQAAREGSIDGALRYSDTPLELEGTAERWSVYPRRDKTLLAVLSPTCFPTGAPGLAAQIRQAIQNTQLYRDSRLYPISQPFLPDVPPYHIPPPARSPPPAEQPQDCLNSNRLLTSLRNEATARALVSLLDKNLNITVTALPPAEERAERDRGAYLISLLGTTGSDNRPWFDLWGALSAWFTGSRETLGCPQVGPGTTPTSILACAAQLAERSLEPEVDFEEDAGAFLTALDAWVIPVGVPTSWDSVQEEELIGYQRQSGWLDPHEVRRRVVPREVQATMTILAPTFLVFAVGFAITARRNRISRNAAEAERVALQQHLDGLHHDLSSPLTTIAALAQTLEPTPTSVALAEEAGRALDVVDTLGQMPSPAVRRAEASLIYAEGVLPAVQAARLRAGALVEILVDPPEADLLVPIRPGNLVRILQNLLDNAIKFRVGAPAHIYIHVFEVDHRVRVEVQDAGSGIAADLEVASLFEPYVRGDAPEGVVGRGLGLHIAADLARRAGGSLRLVRRHGPTTFLLELPLQVR